MTENQAETTNTAEPVVTPEVAATESPAPETLVTEEKAATPEEKPEPKFELKLPEGSKLDANYLQSIEALAKEKGWTNERAQEAVDERHAALTEFEAQQSQALADLNDKTWKDELMKDSEVGGQKFEESGHLAMKGAEWAFGKEFAEELKSLKLNHHPKLFKGLVKIGRERANDKIVMPNQITKGTTRPEEAWYPSMFNKES